MTAQWLLGEAAMRAMVLEALWLRGRRHIALPLGLAWASTTPPPEPLFAAIIFPAELTALQR